MLMPHSESMKFLCNDYSFLYLFLHDVKRIKFGYNIWFLGLNATSNVISSSYSIITSETSNIVELWTTGVSNTNQYVIKGFTSTGQFIKSGFMATATVLSSSIGNVADNFVLLAQNSISGTITGKIRYIGI